MAPHEVVLFLELVRQAHEARRLVYRWERDKNVQTLLALGWQPGNMLDYVAALEASAALGAPRRNRHPDHRNELVCEFGTSVDGQDIYVKMTIVGLESDAAGCVVSFHFAEKSFTFPFVP